jgi:hypothetical protein
MRRVPHRLPAVAGALLVLLPFAGPATPAQAQTADATAAFVVAMEPGTSDAASRAVSTSVGARPTAVFHGPVAGFAAQMTDGQAAALRRRPGVAFVERDGTFTAGKPAVPGPPPPPVEAETQPPGIERVGGLVDDAPRRYSGVGVAIMDTGLPLRSTEVDARDGINCVSPGKPAQDDNGHGTSIGGVVGARANGSATVGVAPGTTLYAVKVLNARASGTLSQLLCGLDWLVANAATHNIKVVNMSISAAGVDDGNCGRTNGEALHRAICALTARGVLVVAAAGNSSAPVERTAPAAYGEVLTVTATTDTDGRPGGLGAAPTCVRGELDDHRASFSNFATTAAAAAHTVAAPGVCVQSTGLKSATSTYYGTSSAAPHAAAVAALCLDDAGRPGPCARLDPAGMIERLAGDGLTGADGFAGDPSHPVAGGYFGPLVTAESY